MEVLLGAVVGLVLSFLLWLVLAHGVAPRLEWGEHLVREDVDGVPIYRFAISNAGAKGVLRRRVILDVSVSAVLRMGRLSADDRYDALVDVPLSVSRLPRLRATRLVRVDVARLAEDPRMAALLRTAQGTLTVNPLESLVEVNGDATIRVYVLGDDSYSGGRRLFVQDYRLAAILRGHYSGTTIEPD